MSTLPRIVWSTPRRSGAIAAAVTVALGVAVTGCGSTAKPTVRSLLGPVIRALGAQRPCAISGRFPVGLTGAAGPSDIHARSVGLSVAGSVTGPPAHGVRRTVQFVSLPTAQYLRYGAGVGADPLVRVVGRPWVVLPVPNSPAANRLANSASVLDRGVAGLAVEVQDDAAVGGCLQVIRAIEGMAGAPVSVRDGGRVDRIGPLPDYTLQDVLSEAGHGDGTFVLTLVRGRPSTIRSGTSQLTFHTPARASVSAPPASTILTPGMRRIASPAASG